MDLVSLQEAKEFLKIVVTQDSNVVGVGIGDNELRVYLREPDEHDFSIFMGYNLTFVVVGDVAAF